MYKQLEYAYPSSKIGGKTGLWYITLKEEDTIDSSKTTVYSNTDKNNALAVFSHMSEKEGKYSLYRYC